MLPLETIHSLDEHWDGRGYPDGLAGHQISLLARIMGLAQTAEVFWNKDGIEAACEMVKGRRTGPLFDPELAHAFLRLQKDPRLLRAMKTQDVAAEAAKVEPIE